MKVEITEYDLKTLNQDKKGLWTYRIKTKTGDIVGSEIKTKEEALIHAENILKKLVSFSLKK